MAARFWVGGTGTWDAVDTTHWSASSGGVGGASVPVSVDDVALDGSSGGGTVTVNTDFTVNSLTTGAFVGTLTFSTNNNSPTMGAFSGTGSAVRTFSMGNGTWTIIGTGTNWNMSTTTSLTFNANSSTIIFTATAAGFTMQGGSLTYNNVTSTSSQTFTLNGTNTFNNLSLLPTNGTTLTPASNQIVNGTFTCTGIDSATTAGQVIIAPTLPSAGTTIRTITAAAVSLKNTVFHNITAAGASVPWSGTGLGDAGGNTNITFPASRTLYWVGNGGNNNLFIHYALSSGGATNDYYPRPQDDVVFDANSIKSAGQTININSLRYMGRNFNFSAVRFNPAISIGAFNPGVLGSITLSSGMTTSVTTAATLTLMGPGSNTITSSGVNIRFNLNLNGPAGTYTFLDDFSLDAANGFTHTYGTLTANANVSMGAFSSSGTLTRAVNMGSGTWTLTGVGAIWNTGTTTALTLNRGTSTIVIAEIDGAGKTFNGGGVGSGITYYNITIIGGGTGDVKFLNAFVCHNFTIQNPKTVVFVAGATHTVDNFTANGVSGSLVYLRSSINGYPWKLIVNNGYAVSFVDVKDSDASGTTLV
jgi:hypothetical protein